jgi:putative oxidoreductase
MDLVNKPGGRPWASDGGRFSSPVGSGRLRSSYCHEADLASIDQRRAPISDRLSTYSPQAPAILRIVAAVLFIEAGSVLLFNIPPTVHPPSPPEMETLLLIAGILELVGGFLILVGLLTRPVAFVLSGMMAVACWGFHAPKNPFPNNNLGAAAILFCFVFLYLVFAGPGAWSVDDARRGRIATSA